MIAKALMFRQPIMSLSIRSDLRHVAVQHKCEFADVRVRCVFIAGNRAVKHAQGKRRLVWLPHPKTNDPIGHALRSAFRAEVQEATPGDMRALLFLLKAIPLNIPPAELGNERDAPEDARVVVGRCER